MDLDRALPSSGLAIYHCDILGSNELQEGSAAKHYQCALLQADGRRDLEMNANQGDGADLFGMVGGIALSAESATNSREWDGRDSGLVLADIGAPGETITFGAGVTAPVQTAVVNANPMLNIPDADPVGISHAVTVAESGTVSRIRVGVNITHTYIGDLLVVLQSPLGRRAILHAQLGGSDDDLVSTYDSSTPGELATMVGQPMHGDWVLTVIDRAAQDVGVLEKLAPRVDVGGRGRGRAGADGTSAGKDGPAGCSAAHRRHAQGTAAAAAARRARQGHASAALTDRSRTGRFRPLRRAAGTPIKSTVRVDGIGAGSANIPTVGDLPRRRSTED